MDESAVARRDFFYIGGEYAGEPGQEVMHGQMYVERLTARERHLRHEARVVEKTVRRRWAVYRRRLRERDHRIAILSNVDRDLIEASVPLLGITPDLIITAEDCRSYKPAPGHWAAFQARSRAEPQMTSIVGEAPSRATKPTTVVGYILIIPVQASDPFPVVLLEGFGERGLRCFVACAAITRNDRDQAYPPN